MKKKKVLVQKVYDNYERGFNGRMKKGDLPEVQQKVTYPHPNKPGELTSQNYIEYDDLAVVCFIRKNEKGQFEYGLMEKEAPAYIDNLTNGYHGIFLEVPSFALPEKRQLPENISKWVEEQVLALGLEMQGFSILDDSNTAVIQSFSNQNARFYLAGIKEGEQDKENLMHWFPISSLESYLDIQRMGGKENIHSSVQSLYPLELLRNKYLSQIRQVEPTKFKLDRPLPELKLIEKTKTNPSYRFSIWEASYINTREPNIIKTSTYIESKSNAGNTVLMTEDGNIIFLSPQKRSPFIATGEELKHEVAGGLTEGRSFEETALAELSEEQGFDATGLEKLTGIHAITPLNNELAQTFIAYYEQGREGKQHLDEQENIGNKVPKSFQQLKDNLKDSTIPLGTKYYIILKARDDENKQKKNEEIER